jgi:DNA-binding transcriptional MerR regulator
MSIKMAELVKRSGVSKSTILYYVKEGLLPEPKKPKPNVHLYRDDSISIINFIKYLQEHLNYTIAEIKSIINDNKIDFKSDSQNIINYLTAMSGTKEKIQEIETIYERSHKFGVDASLFEEYRKKAKELAVLEYEMGAKLLIENSNNDKNELQKLIFDILLTLKPYLFNNATIQEHKKRVEENAKELL